MYFLTSQFMLGIMVSDGLVNAPIRFIEIPVDMGLQILLTAAFQQVPAHQEIGSGHFQLVSLFLVQLMRDLV